VLAQLRLEKDSLRQMLIRREEDLGAAHQSIAALKREVDTEKSRWSVEIDQIRRLAIEDAERRIPDLYAKKLSSEQQRWEQERQPLLSNLQDQLARVMESEQALRLQIQVDGQRASQELSQWSERAITAESQLEDLQNTTATMRDEIQSLQSALQEEQARLVSERAQTYAQIAALQQQVAQLHQEYNTLQAQESEARQQSGILQDQLEEKQIEKEALQQRLSEMDAQIQRHGAEVKVLAQGKIESEKREAEWATAYEQMKEACNGLRAEVAQAQTVLSEREAEWQTQVNDFSGLRAEWEKEKSYLQTSLQTAMEKIAALETSVGNAAATPRLDAGAVQALNTIRQQMKEMGATLTWIRSSTRAMPKAA